MALRARFVACPVVSDGCLRRLRSQVTRSPRRGPRRHPADASSAARRSFEVALLLGGAEEAGGQGRGHSGELIANVVRVDYSTHVAAPANRQLRPHVLALLASSRRRLGGPIVRRLLRESLNAGHRHGSPNAWAAMQSPCLADYILQGQFGQEAVRRGVAPLGSSGTQRARFPGGDRALATTSGRHHVQAIRIDSFEVDDCGRPCDRPPCRASPIGGLRGFRGWRQLFGASYALGGL